MTAYRKENGNLECWESHSSDYLSLIKAVQVKLLNNRIVSYFPVMRWERGAVLIRIK